MRSINDVIQEIEDAIYPIEQSLKNMLIHCNVKPESKAKAQGNLEQLAQLREEYRNLYGVLKETYRQK